MRSSRRIYGGCEDIGGEILKTGWAPPRCTGPSFCEPLPDPRVAVGREGRATAGEEARPSADASAVLLVDSFQDTTGGATPKRALYGAPWV